MVEMSEAASEVERAAAQFIQTVREGNRTARTLARAMHSFGVPLHTRIRRWLLIVTLEALDQWVLCHRYYGFCHRLAMSRYWYWDYPFPNRGSYRESEDE